MRKEIDPGSCNDCLDCPEGMVCVCGQCEHSTLISEEEREHLGIDEDERNRINNIHRRLLGEPTVRVVEFEVPLPLNLWEDESDITNE